ncbi:hypothetical protein NDU88_002024 [Pleurodeles waltl]|uniref:Uncharacterized protein n=1 Tax=Pleurodeles waltl TaxID=8319 RepID=A0AAV7SDR6_PLEWA|nr:hypothetical protein NDU88_002024 [Pleurodeles waltl]
MRALEAAAGLMLGSPRASLAVRFHSKRVPESLNGRQRGRGCARRHRLPGTDPDLSPFQPIASATPPASPRARTQTRGEAPGFAGRDRGNQPPPAEARVHLQTDSGVRQWVARARLPRKKPGGVRQGVLADRCPGGYDAVLGPVHRNGSARGGCRLCCSRIRSVSPWQQNIAQSRRRVEGLWLAAVCGTTAGGLPAQQGTEGTACEVAHSTTRRVHSSL